MVKYAVIGLIAALCVVGVWMLPITVQPSMSVPGKVMPASAWTLVRDRDGALMTTLHDHAEGRVERYAVSQFERGDAMQFTLNPRLRIGARVAPGDTIGSIYSNEMERTLTRLRGELAANDALLRLVQSGEKKPLVQALESRVTRAEERVEQQERVVARLRDLHSRQLIADQDLEEAESDLRRFLADAETARAELQASRTGAKPEQVDLTRAEAEALRREIATFEDRMHQYTVTAPLKGRVARSFGADTLLTVYSDDAFVVVMPVPWEDRAAVEVGQPVRVHIDGLEESVTARVQYVEDDVHRLGERHVLLATALVEKAPLDLRAGFMATCTIERERVLLREHLAHTFQAAL